MKYLRKSMLLAAAFACFSAAGQEQDPVALFTPYIEGYEKSVFADSHCTEHLRRSWAAFSGAAHEYRELEDEYLRGAAKASVCGIRRGYMLYLLLGEVQKLKKKGEKRPLSEIAREAERQVDKMPLKIIGSFSVGINCNSTTPVIRVSSTFVQSVNVTCSTPLGPASVDLHNLHIRVAGKDAWNGPSNRYFGRRL